MSGTRGSEHLGGGTAVPDGLIRWECRCRQTPVLLGTYDPRGCIHIKVRDRHWHILGTVQTRCPRCGAEHVLDLRVGSRKSKVGSRESKPPVTR
jgi:hypothetical protein